MLRGLLGVATLLAACVLIAFPAQRANGAPGAATLSLVSQSEWVVPATPGQSATFDLTLRASGALRSTTLSLSVYPHLSSRSQLAQVAKYGPSGLPLSHVSSVPFASLTSQKNPDVATWPLSVMSSGGPRSGPSISLTCTSQTCGGVYPVEVELTHLSSGETSILTKLTTFLTYASQPSSRPLRVALVMAMTAASGSPAHASSTRLEAYRAVLNNLHLHTDIASTLVVGGGLVDASKSSGAIGQSLLDAFRNLTSIAPSSEVLADSYVPVDPGSLVTGFGESALRRQFASSSTTLTDAHITAKVNAYVTETAISSQGAIDVAQSGRDVLIVPRSDLSSSQYANTTTSGPFTIALSKSVGSTRSIVTLASDEIAKNDFDVSKGGAWSAMRLLADLALTYFERPNTSSTRGIVIEPPATWMPTRSFDQSLFDGLATSPLLSSVTVDQYLSEVSPAGSRRIIGAGAVPPSHSIAAQVASQSARVDAFASALRPGVTAIIALRSDIMGSQDVRLNASGVHQSLLASEHALDEELMKVRFAEHSITLTARTGYIPISIDSTAPYQIDATLRVSGDRFVFRGRHVFALHLDHTSTTVRVDVVARSSGELPLSVTLVTPSGTLVIASSQVSVRSTATSSVGVILTVAALAILLAWWAKTAATRRRRRREDAP